jgi:hypothetical protein
LNQIQEATPRAFVLMMGREKRSQKNPLLQAREYFESLMVRIKHDGWLLSKDGVYFGKPKVPIDCGVVFPNINKYAYKERGLDKVISPEKVFFWDDLHLASDICSDQMDTCSNIHTCAVISPSVFAAPICRWSEETNRSGSRTRAQPRWRASMARSALCSRHLIARVTTSGVR